MNQYKKLVYRNEKEIIPRRVCTDNRLKLLRKAGFNTNGYEHSLKSILQDKGFGLPVKYGEHFVFTVNNKYTRMYLNYADALSEEILLLRELKLL